MLRPVIAITIGKKYYPRMISDMSLRAAEELRRFFSGEKAIYEITREMFDRIS